MLPWWSDFRSRFDLVSLRETIIWNNHNIRVNGQPIFYNNYNSANIVLLSDLKFDLSNTESFNLAKQNGLRDSNFLTWTGVRCAVPSHLSRPSDRVRRCGTAQFGQTRTITHNSQNPAKSRAILKDLLKHLIKSGILLINKIPKNFLGYFQAVYLPKQSRNPSLSSIARGDIKRKAFFRHSAPAWSLVSVRSTFCQFQ